MISRTFLMTSSSGKSEREQSGIWIQKATEWNTEFQSAVSYRAKEYTMNSPHIFDRYIINCCIYMAVTYNVFPIQTKYSTRSLNIWTSTRVIPIPSYEDVGVQIGILFPAHRV